MENFVKFAMDRIDEGQNTEVVKAIKELLQVSSRYVKDLEYSHKNKTVTVKLTNSEDLVISVCTTNPWALVVNVIDALRNADI